ncbi:hypothetical protein HGRIS_014211 [Hohenbuehelia grisea]|uniref:Transmembrane protein n=1 Tax=Hohenbuehelia grisea TaxID=104357 RepID=A0ABR3JU37_9AGAR
MPSFKTLSMIATFAFAAFTVASPMPAPEPVAIPVAELAVRGGKPAKSVPLIFIEADVAIKGLCAEIDVVVDLKKPLVKVDIDVAIGKIRLALDAVVVLIKEWHAHKDLPDCLHHDGKDYNHIDIAHLVFAIISSILITIFKLLKYAGLLGYLVYLPACHSLLAVVTELLAAIIFIVGSALVTVLVTLLSVKNTVIGCTLKDVILGLGYSPLCTVLGVVGTLVGGILGLLFGHH